MEVVNSKRPYTLKTNLHSQNNNPDDTCNFENRRKPDDSTLNKTSTDTKYSPNFTVNQTPIYIELIIIFTNHIIIIITYCTCFEIIIIF